MKKLGLIIAVVSIMLLPMNVFAYSAWVELDDTFDYSLGMTFLGFDLVPGTVVVGDITAVNIQTTTDFPVIDGVPKQGALNALWGVDTATGAQEITVFDQTFFLNPPTGAGVFVEVVAPDPFELTNFTIGVSGDPSGFYPTAFGPILPVNTFTGGIEYTLSVPIPPTVLLLGAGLVGLVGIRRRVKS